MSKGSVCRRIHLVAPLLAIAMGFLWPVGATATPGDLDPAFSTDGFAFQGFETDHGVRVDSLAPQADGKVVAGIAVQLSSGHGVPARYAFYLSRFNLDGSVDEGFGRDGLVKLPDTDSYHPSPSVRIALQSDGRILATKANPTDNGLWVARYLTDGQPDLSFGGGDGAYSQPLPESGEAAEDARIAVTADGRIVVAGTGYEGVTGRFNVVRLLPDGTPDPSFSGDGTLIEPSIELASPLAGVVVDAAGRVLTATSTLGGPPVSVVRYLPDGRLDRTFSNDGIAEASPSGANRPTDLALDPAGRAVIATSDIYGCRNPVRTPQLLRFTDSGELDPSFGEAGIVTLTYPRTRLNKCLQAFSQVAVDAQGRPLIASLDTGVVLGRLTADGAMDRSFSGNGWARNFVRGRFFGDGPVGDLIATPIGVTVGASWTSAAPLAR